MNGLYTKTKFKPILMALINLTVSVVCLKMWGLIGVFIGTLASYLLVGIWVDPYFIFKDVFEIPPHKYFLALMGNAAVMVLIGLITYGIVQIIPFYIGKVLAAGLLSNGLLLLCYYRTDAFQYVFQRIKRLFTK